MTIGSRVNQAGMQSTLVDINDTTPVIICAANSSRIQLRIALPCTSDAVCVVIARSEQDAADLKGEGLEKNFLGNTSSETPGVTFDANSDSQGEKWAILNADLSVPETLELSVNEYIG